MNYNSTVREIMMGPSFASEQQLNQWEKMWMNIFKKTIEWKTKLPFPITSETLGTSFIQQFLFNASHVTLAARLSKIRK